jgi:hypothetical protein
MFPRSDRCAFATRFSNVLLSLVAGNTKSQNLTNDRGLLWFGPRGSSATTRNLLCATEYGSTFYKKRLQPYSTKSPHQANCFVYVETLILPIPIRLAETASHPVRTNVRRH